MLDARFDDVRREDMNVNELAFRPDGQFLFSACRDGTLKVWDLETLECSGSWRDPQRLELRGLDITDDGGTVIVGAGYRRQIGRVYRFTFDPGRGWVNEHSFSPDRTSVRSTLFDWPPDARPCRGFTWWWAYYPRWKLLTPRATNPSPLRGCITRPSYGRPQICQPNRDAPTRVGECEHHLTRM